MTRGIVPSSVSACKSRSLPNAFSKPPSRLNPRTLETDISIICSSMPAFASFSRTYVAKSRHLASLRDRFASYLGASRTKLGSKSKSLPQLKRSHLRDGRSDTLARLHVGQYSELSGGANASRDTVPSVLTKIHATPFGDLEEGIIMESLTVEQSAHDNHVANQL